jgi:hypothetical protein
MALTLGAPATLTHAQVLYKPPPRIEFTPFGSYQWGGNFSTDAFAAISAGNLAEQDSFSWGAVLSFLASDYGAVELFYLRQDTDVRFEPLLAGSVNVGGFANNYLQLGGRQELPTGGAIRPFLSASLGINILDPKADGLGSSTRFAWSLGGGLKFMPEGKRVGLRMDMRWLSTPVPSGTYGTWCDYWGCYAVSGTSWLNQGQVAGGVIFAF